MQLYDCKVRLKGSLYNEVHKSGVSAAEVMLLRLIHGGAVDDMDAVVEIKPAMDAKNKRLPESEVNDQDERKRLQILYGTALESREDVKNVNGVFGPSSALPQVVEGLDDNTVKPGKKPRRTRVKAPGPTPQIPADMM